MAGPVNGVLYTFTGPNGTDLNVWNSAWAAPPTGAASMEIQGNAATASANASYNASFTTASYGSDWEIFGTVTTPPSPDYYPFMLLGGLQNTGSMSTVDGYALYYASGSITVNRVDNGTLTQLGSAVTQTIGAGDQVRLARVGNDIIADYRSSGGSWVELAVRTDTTYMSSGPVGLYSYTTSVRIDDVGGGTLSSGISGSASLTQGANTCSSTGALSIQGSGSTAQAGNTVSATATLALQGSESAAQAGNAVAATGALSVQGSAAIAQAGNTLSATGALAASGSVSATQGENSLSASGQLSISGTASVAQAENSVVGAAQLAIAGTGAIGQGDNTLTAAGSGTAGNTGSADLGQAGNSVSAAAALAVQGASSTNQGDNAVSAIGSVAIIGTLAVQLDDTTVAAAGQIYVAGTAELAQAPNTVTATGSGVSGIYPDPADVAAGVQYGPTGTEYTGTKTGGGAVFMRAR